MPGARSRAASGPPWAHELHGPADAPSPREMGQARDRSGVRPSVTSRWPVAVAWGLCPRPGAGCSAPQGCSGGQQGVWRVTLGSSGTAYLLDQQPCARRGHQGKPRAVSVARSLTVSSSLPDDLVEQLGRRRQPPAPAHPHRSRSPKAQRGSRSWPLTPGRFRPSWPAARVTLRCRGTEEGHQRLRPIICRRLHGAQPSVDGPRP